MARTLVACSCKSVHVSIKQVTITLTGHAQISQFMRGDTSFHRAEVFPLDACIHLAPLKWAVNARTHGTTCTGTVEVRQKSGGTPPSAAIHNSETIFRIPLQSPSCGAPEPHTGFQRCSKLSEHTEASEAVCVPQLPTQVCTKVLSMGQTKPSERAKQNSFTPGCSIPNPPEHANSRSWYHNTSWETPRTCVMHVAQVPTLNKRQKTRAIGRCPSSTGCKRWRPTERTSRKNLRQPRSTQKCARSAHVCPTRTSSALGEFKKQSLDKLSAGYCQPMQRSVGEA